MAHTAAFDLNQSNRILSHLDGHTPCTKHDLISVFEHGCKSIDNLRIGVEHELFALNPDRTRVPYEGASGICALLEFFKQFGYDDVIENGHIIGLHHPTTRQSISLEPGGQFELSGAPHRTLDDVQHELRTHFDQLKQAEDALGIQFLGLGFDPYNTRESIPWMPKARYEIMRRYMPHVGSMGLDMMTRTCTVQVNLDYTSERDMVKKMRTAMALQPLVCAFFAQSRRVEGQDSGFHSYRTHVWHNTDSARSGLLPCVFDPSFSFEAYADYLLDVPMYFVKRNGVYHDVAGQSFRAFMTGDLPGFKGHFPTLADIDDQISVAFPEVRLKRYLEVRGADSGNETHIMAVARFWVHALYTPHVLDALHDLVAPWSYDDVYDAYRNMPRQGFQTTLHGQTIQEWMTIIQRAIEL